MRTPSQIAASRANGARSKGPVSIEGKLNSSRNSLRHGLLANTIVLEEENPERFEELLDSLIEEFQPATPTQIILVETMAAARWRQFRIWSLQKAALDRAIALQDEDLGPPQLRAALAFSKSAEMPQPDLLLRYDTAYDRQFHRALKQLLALQSRPGPSAPDVADPLPSHPLESSPSVPAHQPRPPAVQPSSTAAARESSSKRTRQPVDSGHPDSRAAAA